MFLIAGYHSDVEYDVDFESDLGDLGPLFEGDEFEVTGDAAISGEKGLEVSVESFWVWCGGQVRVGARSLTHGNGGEELKILDAAGPLPPRLVGQGHDRRLACLR